MRFFMKQMNPLHMMSLSNQWWCRSRCKVIVPKMGPLAISSSLETLLLSRAVATYGTSLESFGRISEALRGNALLRQSETFDWNKLDRETLQSVWLSLLAMDEEEGRKESTLSLNGAGEPSGDVAEPPRKKQRISGSPAESTSGLSSDPYVLARLADRMYLKYRDHMSQQIRKDENVFKNLRHEIEAIENGCWDQRLLDEAVAAGSQARKKELTTDAETNTAAVPEQAAEPDVEIPAPETNKEVTAPTAPVSQVEQALPPVQQTPRAVEMVATAPRDNSSSSTNRLQIEEGLLRFSTPMSSTRWKPSEDNPVGPKSPKTPSEPPPYSPLSEIASSPSPSELRDTVMASSQGQSGEQQSEMPEVDVRSPEEQEGFDVPGDVCQKEEVDVLMEEADSVVIDQVQEIMTDLQSPTRQSVLSTVTADARSRDPISAIRAVSEIRDSTGVKTRSHSRLSLETTTVQTAEADDTATAMVKEEEPSTPIPDAALPRAADGELVDMIGLDAVEDDGARLKTLDKRKRGSQEPSAIPESVGDEERRQGLSASPSIETRPRPRSPPLVRATRNFPRTTAHLLNDIGTHRFASLFASAVKEKDAPGYGELIYRPQDLKSIKSAILHGGKAVAAYMGSCSGESSMQSSTTTKPTTTSGSIWMPSNPDIVPPIGIVNSAQLEKELMRMFANAVMFNSDPDILSFAKRISRRQQRRRTKVGGDDDEDASLLPPYPESEDGSFYDAGGLASMEDDEDGDKDDDDDDDEDGRVIRDTRVMAEAVEQSVAQWRAAERTPVVDELVQPTSVVEEGDDDGGVDSGEDGTQYQRGRERR